MKELNHLNFIQLESIPNLPFYALGNNSPYAIQEDSITCSLGASVSLLGLSVLLDTMTEREIKELLYLYEQGEFYLKTSWYDPYIITITGYDYTNGRLMLSGSVKNSKDKSKAVDWYFYELSPSPLCHTADQIAENILFWYAQQFAEGYYQDEVLLFCEELDQ